MQYDSHVADNNKKVTVSFIVILSTKDSSLNTWCRYKFTEFISCSPG